MLKTHIVDTLQTVNPGGTLPPGRPWTTRQLEAAGYNSRSIAASIRARRLHRLRKGIYVDAKVWRELDMEDRQLQHVLAYELASIDPANHVYSHDTAALLHDLSLLESPTRIHITRASSHSTASTAFGVRRHARNLPARDITRRHTVAVTTLERTLIDCAALMRHSSAMVIADQATRLGVDADLMQQHIETMAGGRGIRKIRRIISNMNPLSESPGETLTRIVLKDLDVPMPVLQFPVNSRNGSYRLDFAWPSLKVALEFDGDSKYFKYRPTAETILEERKRERELMEDDWTFVRLVWKDLSWPKEIEARIKAAFARSVRLNG